MHLETLVGVRHIPDQLLLPDSDREDLTILTAMAQNATAVSEHIEQQTSPAWPVIVTRNLADERLYRTVIYSHSGLEQQHLPFVGFVSKKQTMLPAAISSRLADIDKTLVMELAQSSGLLSYSSLELRDGVWFNLVVFARSEVKEHILGLRSHQFAAYELAPSYYQWIRLHHGVMVEGQLSLQKTKYYTFHTASRQPTIYVQTYQPSVAVL